MLYVFHVDAGQMTTYDMSLTLQNVSSLKAAIEKKTKVPSKLLVLLISGGEVLQSDHMVSSYAAGTDTNPIYMFTKPSMKDSQMKSSMCDLSLVELGSSEFSSVTRSAFDGKSLADLSAAVEYCCTRPASVPTVMSCVSLAQQFSDLSHELARSCGQLVHEQHLQHQGWAAVVANLEDIYDEFCERSRNFKESFRKHRLKKEEYHKKLTALNDVLESLGKIPLLSALQHNAEAHRFSAFDEFDDIETYNQYRSNQNLKSSENKGQDFGIEAFKLSEEDVFGQHDASTSKASSDPSQQIGDSDEGVTFRAQSQERQNPTLLHWILAQGNKASLQDILDYCQKGLDLIDAEPLKEHEAELCHILEYANMRGLKQITGIEDRLFRLDKLLNEVQRLERDQHDQAASLIQYRDRPHMTWDQSVLSTLVESHFRQLNKLLQGHETLVDIRRRIARSKDELSHVLKARLGTILRIENSMSVQDAHAMLSFQCFGRLARYFGIVAQLHRAPAVFVRCVHEAARRRTFSQAHLQWANELSAKLAKIHEEEVNRRKEFNSLFEGHFLRCLFPGMSDLPAAFGTQSPVDYDARLPHLTESDVAVVAEALPDLTYEVPIYDIEETVKFFEQRDVETDFNKTNEATKIKTADISTTCVPVTMAASTVTEDNMDTHKMNMEKLEQFLLKLFNLCKTNIVYILEELNTIRNEINEQKKFFKEKLTEISGVWKKTYEDTFIHFKEEIQKLTFDHELDLSDVKATLSAKDYEIATLNTDKNALMDSHKKEIEKLEKEHASTKDTLEKAKETIGGFDNRLEELEALKQKEIKEVQETIHLDYKAQIESMRSRFRLVALTNMDRSPSESSLEKIERTDVIEITSHNAIVMQTKENAEVEKEEAIKEAVNKCEAEWRQKFESEITELKAKYESEKQVTINETTRRLLSEKDRQLDLLREREQNLARECCKYKETIQQLTDPETNDYDSLLKTRLETLENEKTVLRQQVTKLKKELEKKAEEDKSDSDGRSSPKKMETRRFHARCHTPLGLMVGALSISSCLPGHTVLVLWDPAHCNYTVLQESPIMFFVHSDCLAALDLSIIVKNESDRRIYTIATVDSKEYCYAKKFGNRYQMPRGSRFYRVRVRPLCAVAPTPACCAPHPPHPHHPHHPPPSALQHDIQRTLVESSQSHSFATVKGNASEVVTGALINLESPVSASEPSASEPAASAPSVDQLDSIEASEQWQTSRMLASTVSTMTDMECSVGRCGGEPLELSVPPAAPPAPSGHTPPSAPAFPAPPVDTAEEAMP